MTFSDLTFIAALTGLADACDLQKDDTLFHNHFTVENRVINYTFIGRPTKANPKYGTKWFPLVCNEIVTVVANLIADTQVKRNAGTLQPADVSANIVYVVTGNKDAAYAIEIKISVL